MGKDFEIKLYTNKDQIQKGLQEIANKAKHKKKIFRELSQTMLDYIERAFDTEGESMGEKWKNWSEKYYERVRKKIGGDILTKNGDLRTSIRRKVTEDSAVVGTNMVYAAIHNFGYDDDITRQTKNGTTTYHLNMPKRTYMDFTDDLTEQIETELWGWLKIDEAERAEDQRIKELKGE